MNATAPSEMTSYKQQHGANTPVGIWKTYGCRLI